MCVGICDETEVLGISLDGDGGAFCASRSGRAKPPLPIEGGRSNEDFRFGPKPTFTE